MEIEIIYIKKKKGLCIDSLLKMDNMHEKPHMLLEKVGR